MLFFVVCVIAGGVCVSVAKSVCSDDVTLDGRGKNIAILAASIGIAAGLTLYFVSDLHMEFGYHDFFYYEKLTSEGVMYVGMKICGVLLVIENLLAAVGVYVKEMKQTLERDE